MVDGKHTGRSWAWRSVLAVLLAATGCSSSGGAPATSSDAGTSPALDGSTRALDAGAARHDGSTRPLDAGAARHDGGAVVDGAASHDGAASNADAGVLDGGWVLSFSDEFNGADGSAPDPAKWVYTSIGGTPTGPGWGVENDTPDADVVSNGNLVITTTQAADGTVYSGAIDTKGKFEQAYGRFEARIKVAMKPGSWSAFWLMGDTNGQPWPTCGEIDVVETVDSAPKNAYATVHSGNTTNAAQNTSTGGIYTIPTGTMGDAYHLYAVEWAPDSLAFYVDENLYETVTMATLTTGELWAFDHPFYVILNYEVGGSWAGPPDPTTFPSEMLVDYVRVYTHN